jgi:acetolactate synthase-1/2/3 large subunit
VTASRKPLLIAGLGARRRDDADAIRRLCERRQVPAMVTYKAKGVIPDDHPRFAGVFTHGALEQALVAESDLILAVGLDPVELLPRPWTYRQPVIDVGPWRASRTHVPFAGHLVADVSAALHRLEPWLWWSDWDFAAIARTVAEWRARVDVPAAGLTAPRVVHAVARTLMPKARVTVDAGAHMFAATLLCPVSEPGQMLISNGLSTMGFALPAAIGAALLEPTRPVVAITGDGGLLMCAGELLTAARERLPIIVVVLNDSSLSLIEIKQQQRGLAPRGVALGSADWQRLAEGLGVTSFSASNESQLEDAIDRALAVTGPVLIDAIVDRSSYAATLKAVRG